MNLVATFLFAMLLSTAAQAAKYMEKTYCEQIAAFRAKDKTFRPWAKPQAI